MLTTIIMVKGVRVGLVRRTRCGATCEAAAVANLTASLPQSTDKRLCSVDAGSATVKAIPSGARPWCDADAAGVECQCRGAAHQLGLSLALLSGSLLKLTAATCEPLPMGPWDRKAVASAGRLANHLDLHADHFAALALKGVVPRKYNKSKEAQETSDSQLPIAA
ncbi:MAG: hypothetical protein ACRD9R_05010 [Pyrinomonadaceae bacterium]